MKPWHKIPIIDNNEKLVEIPSYFKFIDPHPYLKLSAPYKNKNNIWQLREGVIIRLICVYEYLHSINYNFSLIIYDSWRPIEVQAFMFKRALNEELKKRGIKGCSNEIKDFKEIINSVEKFWAYPDVNKNTPPPHSTGGAVDLTLVDKYGKLVEMGSNIDQMDNSSKPDFYRDSNDKDSICFDNNRNLLRDVMIKFGFVQHPNEWWHFSYGDQLWAWKNKKPYAFYSNINYC